VTPQPKTVLFWVALSVLGPLGCVDPVHEDDVKALGPEDPTVPPGPDHRPGQPCLTCHGTLGPSSHQFSVGGTVYAVQGQAAPAAGATVQIEDITGSVAVAQTSQSGNFYIPVQEWSPTYPTVPQVSLGGVTQQMNTHVGRDGSCGTCHADPPGPTSAGHIYLKVASSGGP